MAVQRLSATLRLVRLFGFVFAVTVSPTAQTSAAKQAPQIPAWLNGHVGEQEGQISRVVLDRARTLYLQKLRQGSVNNPCYFAMDATRPADRGNGRLGRRFYVVCEAKQSFRAVPSGHGSGRNLEGFADFSNNRTCAKNFGNALDSNLTTGGGYITGETRTSFKGYYQTSARKEAAFLRSFVQFEGEGETANARQRAIGGHAAQLLKAVCLRRNLDSQYVDGNGQVLFGKLVDYTAGRSNGCTSWSASDASQIIPIMKDAPTTLYIYPESRDIHAVAQAVKAGRSLSTAGVYWNASCLKQIGTPNFWSATALEPIIARYKASHPAPPPQPLPICSEP